MKRKIILITVLLITLICSTIAFATEDDLNLDVKSNINVNELVGTDETDVTNNEENVIDGEILDGTDMTSESTEDGIMPISQEIPREWLRVPEQGESTRGDLFVFETNANITSNVDGNLYVLADNAQISADVDGNIFVIASNVKITSNVTGSVFALAEKLEYDSGNVKDAYFCANSISVGKDTIISREAKMMADDITVSGIIYGNAYTQSEKFELAEGGYIEGNLVYSGELNQAEDNQISGSTEKIEKTQATQQAKSSGVQGTLESVLFKTFTALVIIGLIVLIQNKKLDTKVTVKDVVKGVLGGILWIIVIPIIIVVLMVTIIGLPVSIILLLLYVLMFFVAVPLLSLQISTYLLSIKNKDSKVLLWLLATLVYCAISIITLIPYIGTLLSFVIGTYSFNLIMKVLFSKKKNNEANVVETPQA